MHLPASSAPDQFSGPNLEGEELAFRSSNWSCTTFPDSSLTSSLPLTWSRVQGDFPARRVSWLIARVRVYGHRWRAGDLVMWDNRPTMHRRLAFPHDQRRIMNRTQIFGEEVVE